MPYFVSGPIEPDIVKLMKEKRDINGLIRALKDKDKDKSVRWYAAAALDELGDARAVEPLIAALEDKYEFSDVRGAAAKALGKLGDARAVKPSLPP